MTMQLGFIAGNSLEAVKEDAAFAQEHGFAALEFNYWPKAWSKWDEMSDERAKAMRAILDDHGVGCSMFGLWGFDHLASDDAARQTARDALDRAIDYAQTLGAHVFTMGGGQIEGASLDEQLKAFGDFFPPYLERIETAGMRAALYAVHGRTFTDSVESYQRLWETFPTVGLKFDPANWHHHGDDYIDVLRQTASKIAHVHIKEHLYHNGELASQPAAGMGDIHWGKVMAFLYEAGYEGCLSIEPHGPVWSKGEMKQKMLLLTQRYMQQFLV